MAWTIPTIESCRDRTVTGDTYGFRTVGMSALATGTTISSAGWTVPVLEACRDGSS